jgi:transposase-like protein
MSNKDGICVPDGAGRRQEVFWTWIHQKVRVLVAQLLEKVLRSEQQEVIGAGWNERAAGRATWRNGHYQRSLLTPHGSLAVKVPRCRIGGLDCGALFDRYQRRVADVDRILRHAYLLGASTRGVAELAEQIFGGSLSHQTVSQLMRWLDEQLALWRTQPIEPVYKVIYIDGMHVDVLGGDRMVMLVAGQREEGRLEVLGFCVSTGESCAELLKDLRRRGLQGMDLCVSDQSGAIRSALEQVYPEVAWQHCTFHRLQALRSTVGPTEYRDAMVAEAACLFRCPSLWAALEAAKAWANRWRMVDAWAVQQFMNGLEDSLMFYALPEKWWRRVRTNNPLERLIRTLRMRLTNMGCFHDTHAVERAVFGQLARWHRIPELTHNS